VAPPAAAPPAAAPQAAAPPAAPDAGTPPPPPAATLQRAPDAACHPAVLATIFNRLPPGDLALTVPRLSRAWRAWAGPRARALRAQAAALAAPGGWLRRLALYEVPLWYQEGGTQRWGHFHLTTLGACPPPPPANTPVSFELENPNPLAPAPHPPTLQIPRYSRESYHHLTAWPHQKLAWRAGEGRCARARRTAGGGRGAAGGGRRAAGGGRRAAGGGRRPPLPHTACPRSRTHATPPSLNPPPPPPSPSSQHTTGTWTPCASSTAGRTSPARLPPPRPARGASRRSSGCARTARR
jgi:hypothetical protein